MSTTPSSEPELRLSVIIPTHQAAQVLPEQLDALLSQDSGSWWELVVVDNGSTDGTTALVDRYARRDPRVRYVAATDRANVSYARNRGAAAARGRALAFVDADDVVAPGWLAAMDAALAVDDLVGGRLEYDRLNPAWATEVRGPAQHEDLYRIEGGPSWPIVFAANLGVRRELHERVGGFDEALPWGGEDADYVWRLHALGVRPAWVPEAVVHYRVRQALRPLYRQAVGYARSRWELHARFADDWPVPPRALSVPHLLARAVRRLPRARTRVGAARYVFDLGWDVGDRAGARLRAPAVGGRRALRVLLVEPSLADDGAVRVSLDRAGRWHASGARVTLVPVAVQQGTPAEVPDGIVVAATSSPAGQRRLLQAGVRLVRLARRSDVVVSGREVGPGLLLAAAAAAITRTPFAVTVQSRPDRALEQYVGARMRLPTLRALRSADLAVCVAAGIVPVLERLGVPAGRSRVVTNGVDVEGIRRAGRAEPAPDLPTGPLVVASGRMHHQKGFDVLLRAHAAALADSGPRHALVLLGDGPDRPALEALARELGVRDTVHFAGFLANPHALVARAELFVLPSRWEGYPLALVEALCLGVPAVAADCVSGPREVLESGRYGRLVPVEDSRALGTAIREHLRSPGDLRARASEAAEVASARFDPALAAQAHLALLTGLVAEVPVASPTS